jgi:hypothetical protein
MTIKTMSQLTTPSSAHTGIQYAGGNITFSGTFTAASVIYCCRVPANCTILDWTMYLSETDFLLGAANQKVVIGTSATNSGLGTFSLSGSASSDPLWSTGEFRPRGDQNFLPCRISLSDDVANADGLGRYVWITAKIEGAPSTSETELVASFWCTYTMGGVTGRTKIR